MPFIWICTARINLALIAGKARREVPQVAVERDNALEACERPRSAHCLVVAEADLETALD